MLNFVNSELLPGIKIKKKNFWKGFSKYVHELAPKNKELLEVREKFQKKIDDWNKHKRYAKINKKQYEKFLKKIGYKKNKGPNFKIKTNNLIKKYPVFVVRSWLFQYQIQDML